MRLERCEESCERIRTLHMEFIKAVGSLSQLDAGGLQSMHT